MSGTPATSTRPGRTWSLRGGGWRLLREPLPVAGPVGPAPAGAERHGRSAAAAGYRGRIGSGSPDRWSRPDGHGPLGRSAAMGGDSCKTVSRSPDRSARPRPTRSLRGGSWRSLPWRLGHGGTVYPAPAVPVRLGLSAAASRGRCRGVSEAAGRSTGLRQASSGSVAPRRRLEVAAGAAGARRKGLPGPGGPRPARSLRGGV